MFTRIVGIWILLNYIFNETFFYNLSIFIILDTVKIKYSKMPNRENAIFGTLSCCFQ